MKSNLDFATNTILSCFLFFFLIIYLYFFIPAAFVQISNLIAELVVPIGIPSKEAKAKVQMHPVIVKAKTKKSSII